MNNKKEINIPIENLCEKTINYKNIITFCLISDYDENNYQYYLTYEKLLKNRTKIENMLNISFQTFKKRLKRAIKRNVLSVQNNKYVLKINNNKVNIKKELAKILINLDENAIKIYLFLLNSCKDSEQKITRATIAKGIGISHNSGSNLSLITKYIKLLDKINLINYTKKYTENFNEDNLNFYVANCYYFSINKNYDKTITKEEINKILNEIEEDKKIRFNQMQINQNQNDNNYYVYRFLDKNNKILYVGRTTNIKQRMKTHFNNNGHLNKSQYKQVSKIEYIICDNEFDHVFKELYFINKWKPPFNTSDLYKGITIIDEFENITWNNQYIL